MEQQKILYINSVGLRKDILSFSQDDPRRKRFFICLKMLAILPCHPQNKNLQFNINIKYKTDNSDQIDPDSMIYTKPQRIHDQLIASHVTCCEHQTPFFSYYHRNLLIYTQLQLNYADQYLRLQNYSQQKQFKEEWKNLMMQYRQLIKQMKDKNIFQQKVMCHYWNPTNYVNLSGKYYNFPIQLIAKNKLQNIDILFEKVNKHLPWNINLRTRFYQMSEQQYKRRDIMKDLEDFFYIDQFLRFNQNQKLIISGESNPRASDPKMVKHFFDNYVRRLSDRGSRSITSIIANEVAMRNKQYFQNEGNHQIVPLYNMEKNEFYLNYGIGIHNQHWLNPTQIKQIYRKIGASPRMLPQYYNTLLPHYQFAYSYVKSQKSFIGSFLGGVSNASASTDYQKKMENSHNTMHNNSCFIMSDPNFSLTNLIFFPYHSWIDYQLQVKIRQLSDSTSYNKAKQQMSYNRQKTVYNLLTNQRGPYTIGNYKLVDWVNPRVGAWRSNSSQSHQAARYFFQSHKIDPRSSFRYSFKNTNFETLVLNKALQHIRRSDQLHQIYKSQYEIDNANNPNFSYFVNLKDYNFNYNYQIYDQGKRIPMDKPNVPIVPSYINKIISSLNVRTSKVQSVTSKTQIKNLQSTSNIQLQGSNSFQHLLYFTSLKTKQRILKNPILALGKYSSLIKSNIYHIQIHFLMKQFQQFGKDLSEDDEQLIKSGFFLKAIPIFSKGKASKTCPKCAPTKKFWIDVADRLRQLYPQIWKILNLYLLQKNRIIYSSDISQKNNQQVQVKTSELLKLTADTDKFKPFSLLEGAQEMEFDVILLGEKFDGDVILKIDLESYSMYNDKIQGVSSKTIYSLQQINSNRHFDFYKVLDVASSSGDNNYQQFDRYYYKKVKGQIRIGDLTKRFVFQVPNYHRVIRYLVKIDVINKKLSKKTQKQNEKYHLNNQKQPFNDQKDERQIFVQIQDRDYEIKYQYYKNWQDDL